MMNSMLIFVALMIVGAHGRLTVIKNAASDAFTTVPLNSGWSVHNTNFDIEIKNMSIPFSVIELLFFN